MPSKRPVIQLSTRDQKEIGRWLTSHGNSPAGGLAQPGSRRPAATRSIRQCRRSRAGDQSKDSHVVARALCARGYRQLVGCGAGPRTQAHLWAREIEAIVNATLQAKPKGMTQWSCRLMAKNQNVSKSTVSNIWRSHNLKPHRVKSFKLSRDARFLESLTDVVGLYLNPPQQALVLCVDEKSQIQALDRTQPGLPLKKGRCGTMTMQQRRAPPRSLPRWKSSRQGRWSMLQNYWHQEFLKFLRRLDQEFPGQTPLHLVMDNYGTQASQGASLAQRTSSFSRTLCRTSSSWLNLVERWFGELTSKRVRRGSFSSVKDLQKAIGEFLAAWNEIENPLSGPPQWNRFSRSWLIADKPSSRSSPVALSRAKENPRTPCPVNSWTLH